LLPAFVCGCDSGRSAERSPNAKERARIVRAVAETWRYASAPRDRQRTRPRLRPVVDRFVVSRSRPHFAIALVELRDRHDERHGARAVIVVDPRGYAAGPYTTFPNACARGTPPGLRELLCPNPWRLLRTSRPGVRPQLSDAQPIPTSNLHALDWRTISLPGGVCGSSRPIRPRGRGRELEASIHPDVDLVWMNQVVVGWSLPPIYGDLDGDGHDEAAINVDCADGSGLEIGLLSFSSVVFKAVGRSLRVVGVLDSQRPFYPFQRAPRSGVVTIRRGRVIATTSWFGRHDATCCPTGSARTVWRYERGHLRPGRTEIVEQPWSSPLFASVGIGTPEQLPSNDVGVRRLRASDRRRIFVYVYDESHTPKRNVQVTVTIAQPGLRIARTRTIPRVAYGTHATVVFSGFARVKLGLKTTVTVEIHDPGTQPVRHEVVFVRP
jgi:hypothetical protein